MRRWVAMLVAWFTLSPTVLGGYFFQDEFATFRPNVWDLRDHGYPPPVYQTGGGVLRLGNPSARSLDFPVMYSKVPVFPSTGDFIAEIAFNYPVRRTKGVGFRALTAGPPYYAVMQFWQGLHPLAVRFGERQVTVPSSTAYRVLRYEVVRDTITAWLNGDILGSARLSRGRPALAYFGHPAVGEIFGIPGFIPANVDANGILRRRWWGTNYWSNLALDYLRVQKIPSRPLTYLTDEFDRFRGDVWDARWHRYPVPFARISGGQLILGRPNVSALDFPVFYTWGTPLPAVADYVLEVAFRYTALNRRGMGLVALTGGPPFYQTLSFWQDIVRPLTIGFGDRTVAIAHTTDWQRLRWEIIGNSVSAYINGSYLGTASFPHGRPRLLYIGHPTVGEPFGLPPGGPAPTSGRLDSNGIVRQRWWGPGPWTNLAVDYLRVSIIPEPPTALLLSFALAPLLRRCRKARRRTRMAPSQKVSDRCG